MSLAVLTTRFVVYRSLWIDHGRALEIDSYRPAFEKFLATRELNDGEQVNGSGLPADLNDMGIINVYRNGRFIYFVVSSNCFIGECVTSEFIWQVDNGSPAIEEILKTTKRRTFHILRFHSAGGWYFWEHD